MKRFLLTVFALFYLSMASGASVQLHYCMGKLADWSLTNSEETHCGKCGMSKDIDQKQTCCKDEVKKPSLDLGKKVSSSTYVFQAPEKLLPFQVNALHFSSSKTELPQTYFVGLSPSFCSQVPLITRICTYRI